MNLYNLMYERKIKSLEKETILKIINDVYVFMKYFVKKDENSRNKIIYDLFIDIDPIDLQEDIESLKEIEKEELMLLIENTIDELMRDFKLNEMEITEELRHKKDRIICLFEPEKKYVLMEDEEIKELKINFRQMIVNILKEEFGIENNGEGLKKGYINFINIFEKISILSERQITNFDSDVITFLFKDEKEKSKYINIIKNKLEKETELKEKCKMYKKFFKNDQVKLQHLGL